MTGHELHPVVSDLIKPAVNFSLFAALIVYAVRSPIGTFIRDRTARIRQALDVGVKAKRDAEALHAQLERDTAELPRTKARMVAEMHEIAERERALLLEKSQQAAARIRLDAKLTAEQEADAASSELRELIVQQAVAEAVRLVREVITPEDRSRAIDEFVQSARAL